MDIFPTFSRSFNTLSIFNTECSVNIVKNLRCYSLSINKEKTFYESMRMENLYQICGQNIMKGFLCLKLIQKPIWMQKYFLFGDKKSNFFSHICLHSICCFQTKLFHFLQFFRF